MGTFFVIVIFFALAHYAFSRKKELRGEPLLGTLGPVDKVYPPFEGKVLKMPEGANSYGLLELTLGHYLLIVRELEKQLGLGMNQPTEVTNETNRELQDLRYRIILLNWILREGNVSTTQIYEWNATCGQPHFYPEIYASSCVAVEQCLGECNR